jgi:predicted ATPase
MFALLRRDPSRAAAYGVELARLAREHDLLLWRPWGIFLEGLSTAESGAHGGGLENMRRAVQLLRDQNLPLFDGLLKIALAEAEERAGDVDRALAILDEALATCERIGHRAFEAELHRVRGEMLLKRDPANPAPAEQAFQIAIAVAQRQGTRSFELRAACSLAKLYQSTARPAEAYAVLAPALEGFSPTSEMPEIAEAQALLATLAETTEVKTAIAQRQRRLGLQTSYARAVLFSKGWAADETKAAFEQAGDLAARAEIPYERFIALYGQCLSALQRGEIRASRDIAERFLREAEAEGRNAETSVAHRLVGFASLFLADLGRARSELELALDSYDIERDSEARGKYAQETPATARAWLAHASWHSGDLDRARRLIKEAIGLRGELDHVPSTAIAVLVKIFIEGYRNDLESVVADAENLLKIGQQHGMDFYVAISRVYLSWARGRLADARGSADELRSWLDAYASQGNRLGVPYFLGCLADLEVAAGDNERALALIDEGLAMADEGGQQVWDAYLLRLQGDILLKRDPAHPAPAEIAYQTAIAVAKRQGARGYELLASLALAKLSQSMGRLADARSVLLPALEGFAPTPEMPEIAEAQALLERLADGGEGSIASTDQATEG